MNVRRLTTAEAHFEKVSRKLVAGKACPPKMPAQKDAYLAHCLADAVPDYVAYMDVDNKWFATGMRFLRKYSAGKR